MNLNTLVANDAKQDVSGHGYECTSCGLWLWSFAGYKVPGLGGRYCSLVCVEHAVAVEAGNTKKIPGAMLGDGTRLLAWLRERSYDTYRQLVGEPELPVSSQPICQNPRCTRGEGGRPAILTAKRAGARYCDHSCRKAHRRPLRAA